MYTGVGTAAAVYCYRFFKYSAQCSFKYLLYADYFGMPLPAAIVGTMVRYVEKVSQVVVLRSKGNLKKCR